MKNRFSALAAGLLVFAPAASTNTCDALPQAKHFDCHNVFESRSGISVAPVAPPTLQGIVYSYCAVPPKEYHLDLVLQHANGAGAWVTRGTRHSDEIPGTQPHATFVYADCQPGLWRMEIVLTGVGPDGEPAAGHLYGNTIYVQSRECMVR